MHFYSNLKKLIEMWDQWHCKMMHTIFLITTIGHTRNIQNWGPANWVVFLEHGITAADQDQEMKTICRGCMRHNSWWLETRAQTGALHTMHVLAGRMELGGRRGVAGECLQKSGQAEWRHDGGNYRDIHSWNFSCAQDHMRSPPEEPHLAVRLKFLQGVYHMQLG